MGYVGARFVVNQANTTDGGAINTVAYASTGASAGQYVGGAYAVNLYTGPFGTLSLDFINNYYAIVGVSKTFSQVITFSRASNATRFAPDGVLQYAPHNLLLQSQTFDNAAWTKTRSSITANTIVAPDGALTGDKLVDTTDALTTHFISQSTSFVSGTTYTTTLFAKQGEIRYVRLGFGATAFGAIHVGFFDLQNGVVTSTSGTVTTSITSVGNGWWRVLVTATATATASDVVQINLSLNGTSSNFTGDGTSGIYIWGAQLAVGPYPLDYTPTTTAVVYGPRFDYNPTTLAPLGLLIEEQRTNLVTYSEQFDNAAWTKQSSVTVSANTTVAPDGTTSGDTVTADSGLSIYQSVAATIGTTYCQSVFIKAGTATSILLRDDTGAGRSITINPSTGAITATSGTLVTSGSQAIQNGWWRYWFAYVADAATVRALIRPFSAGAAQTFIVWGAQTEAGAFPTSYIPTVASTVTRSADVASINTLSPWYNATEGTLFVEGTVVNNIAGTSPRTYAEVGNSSSGNERFNLEARSTTSTRARITVGGVATISSVSYNALGTNTKLAGAYGADGVTVCVAGLSPVTTATSVFGTVTSLFLGNAYTQASATNINGHLRCISYYNRRLTNAELQVLTS